MLFNYTSYNDITYIFKFDILSLSVYSSIFIVLTLLVMYIPWYMSTEPNKYQFYLLISFFSSSILLLSITKFSIIFLIFWEFLSVSSYLLVSWWSSRQLARSLAVVSLLSSRVSDICLFIILTSPIHINDISYSVLLLLAISSKSAQFMYFPWLLSAIESPSPVSALLHSSTLVLASVILCFRINDYSNNNMILIASLISIIYSVLSTYIFLDLNRRVACSTVYNVSFLFVWIYLSEYDILYLHMIFHAVVNSSTFVLLSITTHLIYVQDVRSFVGYTHNQISNIFIMLLICLSALPLVSLSTYNETAIDFLLDTSTPVILNTILFSLSWVSLGFVFEYLLLIIKGHNSYVNILPLPAFLHSHMLFTFPASFLMHSYLSSIPINNVGYSSSYILFFIVGVSYVTFTYSLAINWDLNNYLSNYNAMLLDNMTHLKRQIISIEFFSIFQIVNNSEWFVNNNWSHGTNLSFPLFILSITITTIMILIFR